MCCRWGISLAATNGTPLLPGGNVTVTLQPSATEPQLEFCWHQLAKGGRNAAILEQLKPKLMGLADGSVATLAFLVKDIQLNGRNDPQAVYWTKLVEEVRSVTEAQAPACGAGQGKGQGHYEHEQTACLSINRGSV